MYEDDKLCVHMLAFWLAGVFLKLGCHAVICRPGQTGRLLLWECYWKVSNRLMDHGRQTLSDSSLIKRSVTINHRSCFSSNQSISSWLIFPEHWDQHLEHCQSLSHKCADSPIKTHIHTDSAAESDNAHRDTKNYVSLSSLRSSVWNRRHLCWTLRLYLVWWNKCNKKRPRKFNLNHKVFDTGKTLIYIMCQEGIQHLWHTFTRSSQTVTSASKP